MAIIKIPLEKVVGIYPVKTDDKIYLEISSLSNNVDEIYESNFSAEVAVFNGYIIGGKLDEKGNII